jgi:hypothetical protein
VSICARATLSAKNPIDPRFQIVYGWESEWQFEVSTAARERAAAAQRGSRVLIPSPGFLQPHCPTAVGFLFCRQNPGCHKLNNRHA